MPVVVPSAGESQPFSGKMVRQLLDCDYITSFNDRGWHCIAGFRDGNRVVFAHADTADQISRVIASSGYKVEGGVLVEMSIKERRAAIEKRNANSDYPDWRDYPDDPEEEQAPRP